MPGPFECVIFDCDSTLTQVEGVNLLAGSRQKEIEDLTNAAMSGKNNFREIYKKRLDLIRPNFTAVSRIGNLYLEKITSEAKETVQALQFLNKRVFMISGGFRPALSVFARHLGING